MKFHLDHQGTTYNPQNLHALRNQVGSKKGHSFLLLDWIDENF